MITEVSHVFISNIVFFSLAFITNMESKEVAQFLWYSRVALPQNLHPQRKQILEKVIFFTETENQRIHEKNIPTNK